MSTARSPTRSRTAASQPSPAARRPAASAEHRVVRATPQRELPLCLVSGDRDRPQPERLPQLDGRGPDASRRAVHEQRLTRLRPGPPDQREQAGQVVEGSGRARLEAHPVRQREDPFCEGH